MEVLVFMLGVRRTCTFDEGGDGLSGWREQSWRSEAT